MQQIAACFVRCNIGVCLAETVHAAWLQLGMTKLSLGAAVLFDLSAALRSQVFFTMAFFVYHMLTCGHAYLYLHCLGLFRQS